MGKKLNSPLNYDHLRVSTNIMRALAHPLRLRMIGFLLEHQVTSVQSIYNHLAIEQSVASQHLRILRDAGLVFTERHGKFVEYLVNRQLLEQAGIVAIELIKKGK